MTKNKFSGYTLLALTTVYMFLHFAQHHQFGSEWLRFYGKDLILIPLLIIGTQLIGVEFNKSLRVSKTFIVIIVVYVSIVFEWLIPFLRPSLKADPIDILMYSIGGIGYFTINKIAIHIEHWKSSTDL